MLFFGYSQAKIIGLCKVQEICNEADFSTIKYQEEKDPRFQEKDEYPMGQRNPEKEEKKGEEKAGRVSFRFPGDERIRRRKDFIRVYSEGRRHVCPEFVAFYLKTDNDLTRLGMSVGRKAGGAVTRNRIKRRIREVFRLNKHLLKPGYDIVIIVREGSGARGGAGLEGALTGFFSSAGLRKAQ